MTQEKFIQGFIKQAEQNGFTSLEAQQLLKEAGLWDIAKGAGNFLYDGVVQPIKGMWNEGKSAVGDVFSGDWRSAGRHALNFAGNAAMTGLNFIPGAGLGSMAIRGGLKAAGGLAARAGLKGVAGMAGKAMGGFNTAQNIARGAVGRMAAPIMNTAGNMAHRVGTGISNVAGRNFVPGSAMGNSANWVGNQVNRIGTGLQNLGQSASSSTGVFSPLSAKSITGARQSTTSAGKVMRQPSANPNFSPSVPRAGITPPSTVTPNPGMMHQARTWVQGKLPTTRQFAGGMAAAAPVTMASNYVTNYRQDLEDNPYGDMNDYFHDSSNYL